MLHKISNNGACFERVEVPYKKEYEDRKLKLKPGEFETIYNFLDEDVVMEDTFIVGIKYNKNTVAWNGDGKTPGVLAPLYYAMNQDAPQGGIFLGLIVMDVVIHQDEDWFCLESDMIKRDFTVLRYFKGDK